MKALKRIITILLIVAIITTVISFSVLSIGASGTGTGLASWALKAYNEGWSYVYGGSSEGAVDCSGLIYSYTGNERCGDDQLYASSYTGSVSSGIPNIHGLGLWQPGHVGIYIGNGTAVDARGDEYGVVMESAYSHNWSTWFKVNGVSYPDNGWETFCGEYYYYEDGEYITDTTRTIDGETYYFSSSGICSSSPSSSSSDDNENTTEYSSSLRIGSTGQRVKELQERLKELGYYDGAIDGDFGVNTEKAFKAFQNASGLVVDGIAGSDINILYDSSAVSYEEFLLTGVAQEEEKEQVKEEEKPTEYKKGDFSEEIKKAQEKLIELGYFEGEADGSFGSSTEQAVMAFQDANNLAINGILDETTLDVLFSSDAKIKETIEETKVVETVAPATKEVEQQKAEVSSEIPLQTKELSKKALSNITDKIGFESDRNGNNFEFLTFMIIMVGVLVISFIVVYVIEAKRKKKNDIKNYK